MDEPPIRALLEVEVPGALWVSRVSRDHPDLRMEVLSLLPLGAEAVLLVRMEGPGVSTALEEVRAHPSVVEFQQVSPEPAVVRVKMRGPHPLGALLSSEALLEFPFPIRGGRARWSLVCARPQLDALLTRLRQIGIPFETERVEPYRSPGGLTPRQQEVLDAAYREGYFDVPRRVTLAQLAERLGVAKSTLSETLRRAQRRMARR